MHDEEFEYFLSKFGSPLDAVPATQEQLQRYQNVLPDQLLTYWQQIGFAGFQQGLFWLTYPDDFNDIVDKFLQKTPLQHQDKYHAIARSAYGKLYLWGEESGHTLTIMPYLNWIKMGVGDADEIAAGEANTALQYFFSFKNPDEVDIELKSKPFFPKVLKKHGPVGPDEVITFAPYLFMGGKKLINNTHKEDLHTFLQIVADMGNAEIIDMASMVKGVMKQYGEG